MGKPKEIKIVVSDFHMGSGRWLPDGRINVLEDFFYDEKFVEFLGYYSTGEHEDSHVELVLNGDFLNLLQVDYMQEFPDVITEEVSVHTLRKVIKGHPEVWNGLARFAKKPGNRIVYIVGNHDPGLLWKGVRDAISERIGVEILYPIFSYMTEGIWIEHGMQYEASNRFNQKQLFLFKSLPKPILSLPWGSQFVIHFLNKVKKERPYVDKVRPFRHYIKWALIYDWRFALRTTFKTLWFFLSNRFTRSRWRYSRFSTTVRILKEFTFFPRIDLAAEKILTDPAFHTVIFGHVHRYEYRVLEQGKVYINTGTWNDTISLDVGNLGRHLKLTYAFLEKRDEKWNVRLKEWKGYARIEEDVWM